MNKRLYFLYWIFVCMISGSMQGAAVESLAGAAEPIKSEQERKKLHVAVEQQAEKPKAYGKRPKQRHHRRHSTGETESEYPESATVIPGSPKDIRRGHVPSHQQKDTALMHAIKTLDDQEVERLLVKKRVNAGVQNNFKETPLMIAADYNNKYAVGLLVQKHPETINLQDDKGDTALMYAIREGYHPIVDMLLASGANPLLDNKEDQTALMIAARRNDVDSTRLLLSKLDKMGRIGDALRHLDRDGSDTLQIARQTGAHDAEKLLLKYLTVDLDPVYLIYAAQAGDVKQVDAFLANKVDVNYRYGDRTPLLAAVNCNALPAMDAIVTALLQAGANPNVVDAHERTPLMILASRHFDEGWRVFGKDRPLSSEQQCAIITKLLDAGADIEGRVQDLSLSKRRSTPLIDAIINFNPDVAQLLLQRGANTQAQYNKQTVFDYARKAQNECAKIEERTRQDKNEWVEVLEKARRDKVAPESLKEVLDMIEGYDLKIASYQQVIKQWVAIEIEIKKKKEAKNRVEQQAAFLLVDAARAGNADTVKFLLENGAKVNCQYASYTPLLAAVRGEDRPVRSDDVKRTLDTVRLLLQAGADPNICDAAGNSALAIVAARHFDPNWFKNRQDARAYSAVQCQIMEALLDFGAKIDGGIQPPLIAAISNFNADAADVLIGHGANINAHYKGQSAHAYLNEVVKELNGQYLVCDQWRRIEFEMHIAFSPLAVRPEGDLLQAINSGDAKSVADILGDNAGLDLAFDLDGYTPLLLAIDRDNVDIMQQLFKAGADINQRDKKDGQTPLMRALANDFIKPALFLLNHGADVNARDNGMSTPLMYFAISRLNDRAYIQVLKLLLAQGAQVTSRNDKRSSALDLLAMNNDPNVVDPEIRAKIIQILQEAAKRELPAPKAEKKDEKKS